MRVRDLKCDKIFPVGKHYFDENQIIFERLDDYLAGQEEMAAFFVDRADGRRHAKPNLMETAGLRGYAKSFTNVYFIICSITGLVKIGRADNVGQRLSTLQISSPGALSILGFFRAPSSFENFLHCLFSRNHVRGEWFKLSDELLDLIEDGVDKNYLGALSRSRLILHSKKPLTS